MTQTHVVIKLISGDTVLGRLDSRDENHSITLQHPVVVTYVVNPSTGFSDVYLLPYNPFFKEPLVTIYTKHMFYNSDMDKEYIEYYERFLRNKANKDSDISRINEQLRMDGIYPSSTDSIN